MPISLLGQRRFSLACLPVTLRSYMIAVSLLGCTGLNHRASDNTAEEPARDLTAEEVPAEEVPINETKDCKGTLTERQVIEIANRAIEVSSGEPSRLEEDFDLFVYKVNECQYLLSGIQESSTLHFRIRMTSAGEILSPPWCCVPGFEVDVSDLIQEAESEKER